MRPNKDPRTEIILYGLLLIPLLFAAAALAQATEQAQGLAEITAVLSEILHTPSMLRWCASTPKFLLAVLVFDGRLRCALERNLRRQKYARFMTPPPSVKPASSGKKREAA